MARPTRDNLPVPAAAGPAPVRLRETAPGKAAVHYWKHRAAYAPPTGALALLAAGCEAHRVTAAADALGLGLGAAAATVGHVAHRRWRKRNARPLVNAHRLFQAALGAASINYLAWANAVSPARPGMLILLGAEAVPLGIAWWSRRAVPAPQPADAQQDAPADPAPAAPAPTLQQRVAAAWDTRLAAPNGVLPRTALAQVTDLPDGGFKARIDFNVGDGAVRDLPEAAVAHTPLIAQAFKTELRRPIHHSNVVVQPHDEGHATLFVFERNPQQQLVRWPGPGAPGTFTHPLAMMPNGRFATYCLWHPEGGNHSAIVGSTGTGKSVVQRLLLAMEANTLNEDGEPVVASWLLDPHGGSSYGPWPQKVDRFVGEPERICASLEDACREIDVRLTWMRRNRVKQMVPSTRFPLLIVSADEFPRAVAIDPRIVEPSEYIASGGRKVNVLIRVITQSILDDYLPSAILRDSLASGDVILMRGASFYTKIAMAPGEDVDPRGLPKYWADGQKATGLGYLIVGGSDSATRLKFACPDDEQEAQCAGASVARPARPAPQAADEAGPDESVPVVPEAAPVFARSAPARGVWAAARDYLAALGEAARVREIAGAIGATDTAVVNALQRSGGEAVKVGGGWILAIYTDAAAPGDARDGGGLLEPARAA